MSQRNGLKCHKGTLPRLVSAIIARSASVTPSHHLVRGTPGVAMNCNELQEGMRGSRYVIKRPKALQWFYKGRLYKASDEERQAGRFELFLDLLCA